MSFQLLEQDIHELNIRTPYYLINESRLLKNLKKIEYLRSQTGVKCLLALKCFATWSVFDLMKNYMDGTTSSSLYEARLGYEKFGGETHAFSVAYDDSDIEELIKFSDKIIFNSISQLKRYSNQCKYLIKGLRINPNMSYSGFDLADPAREFSRLGVNNIEEIESILSEITGAMFHYNCENSDIDVFENMLSDIGNKFGSILHKLDWVSLGGGIHFTGENYDINRFCDILRSFSNKYSLQIYLEPGEATITQSTTLETTILDIVENEKKIAIVDSSIEPHMLDLLIYREEATFCNEMGDFEYQIAGRSCLAGDIFGNGKFAKSLEPGDRISICNAGGYTMVKKNWFNGLRMPSIAVKRLNNEIELIKEFNYNDYINSLS